MYKNFIENFCRRERPAQGVHYPKPPLAWDQSILRKVIMRINLTIMLVIAALIHVTAAGHAQEVSLSKKNASLEEIFKEINRQTGYNFLWSARKIKNTPGIDAHFENMPVTTVLDRILTGLPLTYTIEENTIIIQKKEE